MQRHAGWPVDRVRIATPLPRLGGANHGIRHGLCALERLCEGQALARAALVGSAGDKQPSGVLSLETPMPSTPPTCIRNDTACSCDLRPYSLVTAWRLRMSDLAITRTASCT